MGHKPVRSEYYEADAGGVMSIIVALEDVLGKTAEKNMLPIQPGDMPATWADATLLHDLIGPMNKTDLKDGVTRVLDRYKAEAAQTGETRA